MNGKNEIPLSSEPEPCGIRVDESGDWFYNGSKIFRAEILEELYARLDQLPTGQFILSDFSGPCLLDVADTPFVVSRVDLQRGEAGTETIVIRLKNISRPETLDPHTLATGKSNVLYCRVADGRFLARFSRPAYYQLADLVHEDVTGQGFYIGLNGNRYYIAVNE